MFTIEDNEVVERDRFGVIDSDEELEINIDRPKSSEGSLTAYSHTQTLIANFPALKERILADAMNAKVSRRVQKLEAADAETILSTLKKRLEDQLAEAE